MPAAKYIFYRTGLVLLLFLGLNGCQGYKPYVPGERGADWTLEETLIVKAKLMTSMDLDGSWSNMWQVCYCWNSSLLIATSYTAVVAQLINAF